MEKSKAGGPVPSIRLTAPPAFPIIRATWTAGPPSTLRRRAVLPALELAGGPNRPISPFPPPIPFLRDRCARLEKDGPVRRPARTDPSGMDPKETTPSRRERTSTVMRFASRKDEFLPRAFYNIKADLPEPPRPPLHPGTKETLRPEDLEAIFPRSFIRQEGETAREVPIPGPVLEAFSTFRPTPLVEATALRRALDTPARIFYKYEGAGPVGSHKTNTALMQAYLAAEDGVKTLATETGAGQWGSALAYAGSRFGIETRIFMVRSSYRQKPGRRDHHGDVRRQRPREPRSDDRRGSAVLRAGPRPPRQSRHRHLRSGRVHGQDPRRQVCPGFGARQRPHAPDRHRPRGRETDGRARRRT